MSKNNQRLFDFDALVDSGVDFCVFPANSGKAIGLDVEVTIKDEPWVFECRAGFSTKLNAKGIGFLGRDGFFDLFQEVSFNQNIKMFRLKEF